MRLSAIFTGWFIILKFLFNMEINMFDMNEKITVILEKMFITAGKMSVIAAVVQHPRHFFKIIALIADTGPHVQSLRNPNGLPGERIGVQPSEANFPDRFGFSGIRERRIPLLSENDG